MSDSITIEKGMFTGLTIDVGRMPKRTEHAFVTTYKERPYYVEFDIFDNGPTQTRYDIKVRGADSYRTMAHHGMVDKLQADLENIDVCSLCHNPSFGCTIDTPWCRRCTTDSCFKEYPVNDCAICMQPLRGLPDTLVTTKCFHIFHKWCLSQVHVKTRVYEPRIFDDDDDMDGDTYEIRDCPMCKGELRHVSGYFKSD